MINIVFQIVLYIKKMFNLKLCCELNRYVCCHSQMAILFYVPVHYK